MPPAKSIFVDKERILARVAEVAAAQAASTNDYHDGTPLMYGDEIRQRKLLRDAWVARDLEDLAGKPLTASERIRHQQAIRQLEADGLVELEPRWVKLTEAGRVRVASAATTAPDSRPREMEAAEATTEPQTLATRENAS